MKTPLSSDVTLPLLQPKVSLDKLTRHIILSFCELHNPRPVPRWKSSKS